MKGLILKLSGVLLVALFFEWWLLYYSGFDIPTHVPNTPINIAGLTLLILWVGIFILLDKKLLAADKSISIWRLTYLGVIVCGIAEFIFQIFRQTQIIFTSLQERLLDILVRFFGEMLLVLVISFFVAFHIKTKKTGLLMLFILIFLVAFVSLVNFIRTFIPAYGT